MKISNYSSIWKSVSTLFLWVSFLAYVIVLFNIICLKHLPLDDFLNKLFYSDKHRGYNLVPFATIYSYASFEGMSMLRRLGNTFGNIFIFIPIGLILPLISHRVIKIWRVLIISFLLSLSLELLQYFSGTGTADIDDVLLNAIGGLLGYGIFLIYKLILKHKHFINIAAIATFLLLVLFGGWIAIIEFHLDLGYGYNRTPVTYNTVPTSDKELIIPVSESPVKGKIEAIAGDTIKINKYIFIKEDIDEKSTRQIFIISKPLKDKLSDYILSSNSYVIRKDVEQLSNVNFNISYSKSHPDSISIGREVDIWTNYTDPTHVDTICYRVLKKQI